jgi:hypothetical protein
MRIKLTPAFVASAKTEPGKERSIYWDSDLAGFGLMVTANAAKSFVVQYRNDTRQSRRMTISADLRLGEARKEAKAIMGRVAKSLDPLAERRLKEAAATNTLQSVCESYFAREGRRLRTVGERQKQLRRLVYPRLGSRQIEEVKRSHVVISSTGLKTKTEQAWQIMYWPICARRSIGTQPGQTTIDRHSRGAWLAKMGKTGHARES